MSATSGLYRRWVLANGWSECVGLGGTGLLGWWVMRVGEPSSIVAVLGVALLAVLGGTVFEGFLVGYAQARVLHRQFPDFSSGRWILATAIGAGIAWLLGMIPSTAMALAGPAAGGGDPPAWLNGPAQYVLAAAMGLVLGPILAVPQMLVLRATVQRAGRWISANALAWAIGMPVIFVGAGAVSHQTSMPVAIGIVALSCLAAGLVVGAVHGLFLVKLVQPREAQ